MLSENRFSKYILYAAGEIILVVIGILIALQINNLNEQRKDRVQEQVILKQLQEDYRANLKQLEEKIATRQKMIKSAFGILEAIDRKDGIDRDSLIHALTNISNAPTFDPIQNDLISSGNIRLIRNDTLKRILSNWSSDKLALMEVESMWSNKVYTQLEPLYYRLGIGRDISFNWLSKIDHQFFLDDEKIDGKFDVGTSVHNITVNEIIKNKEIEGIISDSVGYSVTCNIQAESLIKRINKILALIEHELVES